MKRYLSILLGAAVLLLGLLASSAGLFGRLDRSLFDLFNRIGSTTREADERVVMVAVDQASLDLFAEHGVLWPWPRDLWAHLLTVSRRAGAKAVLFDIMFDEAGIDRLNSDGYAADMAFASALSDSSIPAIISCQLSPSVPDSAEATPSLLWGGPPVPAVEVPRFGPDLPHPRFRAAPMASPNVSADVDGIIRFVPYAFATRDGTVPSLALRVLEKIGELPEHDPTDGQGRLWLRFYGEGGASDTLASGRVRGGSFRYYPASALILGQIPPEQLEDRILIVGGYASGLLDYVTTPTTNPVRPFPGFELHATTISNLLQKETLSPLARSRWIPLALVLGLAALVGLFFGHSSLVRIIVPVLFTALLLLIGWWLWEAGFLFPIASAALPGYFALATQVFVGWTTEGRNRKRLFQLFSRYLDSKVIEQMVDTDDEVHMEGEEKRVAVMFTDYKGFTTVSEQLSPTDVVAMLNEYFQVVVDVVLEKGGMLDKYIGDAIMVLFGAPFSFDDVETRCAEAVIEVQQAVDRLSAERGRQGLPELEIRIGVHVDTVTLGNMGHPKRMDYTAIGPGVNLASRVESSTRTFGTTNLVTDDFLQQIDGFASRQVVRVVLKGLSAPRILHELVQTDQAGPWVESWEQAWSEWRAGRRSEALGIWRSLREQRPEDEALQKLLERLEPHEHGKKEDDDVVVMHSK